MAFFCPETLSESVSSRFSEELYLKSKVRAVEEGTHESLASRCVCTHVCMHELRHPSPTWFFFLFKTRVVIVGTGIHLWSILSVEIKEV